MGKLILNAVSESFFVFSQAVTMTKLKNKMNVKNEMCVWEIRGKQEGEIVSETQCKT